MIQIPKLNTIIDSNFSLQNTTINTTNSSTKLENIDSNFAEILNDINKGFEEVSLSDKLIEFSDEILNLSKEILSINEIIDNVNNKITDAINNLDIVSDDEYLDEIAVLVEVVFKNLNLKDIKIDSVISESDNLFQIKSEVNSELKLFPDKFMDFVKNIKENDATLNPNLKNLISMLDKTNENFKNLEINIDKLVKELSNSPSFFGNNNKNIDDLDSLKRVVYKYLEEYKAVDTNKQKNVDFRLMELQNNTTDSTLIRNLKIKDTDKNEKLNPLKEDDILKSIITDEKTPFTNILSKGKIAANTSNTKLDPNQTFTLNKETFQEDIIKTIKYMNTESIKELQVKVRPKELGDILIKIIESNGELKAEINVKNKETQQLIQSNINEIKKASEIHGINLKDIEINGIPMQNENESRGNFQNQFSFNDNNGNTKRGYNQENTIIDNIMVNEEELEINNSNFDVLI